MTRLLPRPTRTDGSPACPLASPGTSPGWRHAALKENGREPSSPSCMWVQRGGPPGRAVIPFQLGSITGTTSRHRLAGRLPRLPAVRRLGCLWRHRRQVPRNPTHRLLRPCPANIPRSPQRPGQEPKTRHGQAGARPHRPALWGGEVTQGHRPRDPPCPAPNLKARPILDALHAWLVQALPEVPPSTLTGKALTYLDHQWPQLIGYLDDGRLAIEHNACERHQRPLAI